MRKIGGVIVATWALTLLTIAAGAVSPTGTAAGADPIGRCSITAGTIVAVDFSHWGGPTVRGCGVSPRSGYSLLHDAGFSTAGDSHDGPGFICRIGNRAFAGGIEYPTPAQDACIVTPPANAYWSYWSATAGRNTWSYSPSGGLSHVPTAGEVDLWIFGATDLGGTSGSGVPSFSPDSVRAHNLSAPAGTVTRPPATRPGSTPPTNPGPPATVSGTGLGGSPSTVGRAPGSGPAPASGTNSAPTTISIGAEPTSTTVAGTPTTSAPAAGNASANAPSPSVPQFVDALPVARGHSSAGSFVPVLVAVGLIVVLGGGAATTMWRRRQTD